MSDIIDTLLPDRARRREEESNSIRAAVAKLNDLIVSLFSSLASKVNKLESEAESLKIEVAGKAEGPTNTVNLTGDQLNIQGRKDFKDWVVFGKGNDGAGNASRIFFTRPGGDPASSIGMNNNADLFIFNESGNFAGSKTAHLRIGTDNSSGGDVIFCSNTFVEMMRVRRSSRNVLIGTTTDVASAILNVQSTNKGFLPPRMTTAQMNAIVSPAEGLMVYVTDAAKGWYGYTGTAWQKLNA